MANVCPAETVSGRTNVGAVCLKCQSIWMRCDTYAADIAGYMSTNPHRIEIRFAAVRRSVVEAVDAQVRLRLLTQNRLLHFQEVLRRVKNEGWSREPYPMRLARQVIKPHSSVRGEKYDTQDLLDAAGEAGHRGVGAELDGGGGGGDEDGLALTEGHGVFLPVILTVNEAAASANAHHNHEGIKP